MILTARDGFVVYNLRTNTATHYLSNNYSSLDTKSETTIEAVKQFESFRETLPEVKKKYTIKHDGITTVKREDNVVSEK